MFLLFFFVSLALACSNIGTSVDCSGNGLCIYDQRNNSTRCVCDTGFLGENCANTCTMIGFAAECSKNGICAFDQRANGTRCVCDMGFYGRFCSSNTTSTTLAPTLAPTTTASLSTLSPNTTLPQTTFTTTLSMASCIDYSKGAISVCNGHGTCETYPPGAPNSGNYCQCQEKYHGTYCEKEYKSKWIAFLLEFFVGWTGAESFYIGDIVAGVNSKLKNVHVSRNASINYAKRSSATEKNCRLWYACATSTWFRGSMLSKVFNRAKSR